jgi:hypothetical protein
MKKTALLAAAAALFAASPAMASGHVGATYGTTEADTADVDTWQVEGAFGASSGSFGFQLDAGLGNAESDFGDVDTSTLAGHVFWNGGNWRLGAVIATANLDDGSLETDESVYGVEGTYNLGANAVIVGSYTIGESEFLVDLDSWNADIGLNYYFTDNLRVSGTIGSGNLDAGGGFDLDTSSLGISGEWQPWTTPVSFTAGWSTFDADLFGDYDTITVGARWNFGGSLRERDNDTPFETRAGLYQRVYGVQ